MTSDFKLEVVTWLKLHMCSENSPQLGVNNVRRQNFPRHIGNRCC